MDSIIALGPRGTYGHEAAQIALRTLDVFGKRPVNIQFRDRNQDVLAAAVANRCYGVVPVENGQQGLVLEVVRCWLDTVTPQIQVIGEVVVPVEHCLLVHPEAADDEISSVMSHPQALGQCSGNLDALRLMKRIPSVSTAGAAEMVSSDPKYRNTAALASAFAAEVHGLRVMRKNMQDSSNNATRFHVLGFDRTEPTGKDRTAVIFTLNNWPNALLRALGSFEGINLTSIHSMPLGELGQYAFYVEFDGHQTMAHVAAALTHFKCSTTGLHVLGSYPQFAPAARGGES